MNVGERKDWTTVFSHRYLGVSETSQTELEFCCSIFFHVLLKYIFPGVVQIYFSMCCSNICQPGKKQSPRESSKQHSHSSISISNIGIPTLFNLSNVIFNIMHSILCQHCKIFCWCSIKEWLSLTMLTFELIQILLWKHCQRHNGPRVWSV